MCMTITLCLAVCSKVTRDMEILGSHVVCLAIFFSYELVVFRHVLGRIDRAQIVKKRMGNPGLQVTSQSSALTTTLKSTQL